MKKRIRKRLRISGIVQGVGFRPFVWKRATDGGLTGWIHNDSAGVTIEIQGPADHVQQFVQGFSDQLPPLTRIDSLQSKDIAIVDESDFAIRESAVNAAQSTPVSSDIGTCDDCHRELFDPADRRFRYPFINCTNCGPRFTIVTDIPYDRRNTTMCPFTMCDACQREYDDPANRRFHAQPNACADCGPRVWFVDSPDADSAFDAFDALDSFDDCSAGESALTAFHRAIGQGRIVAVKGIGGFHLACDAANETAIAELRRRKGRVDKPLAVMVADVQQARQLATVSASEASLLDSKERPIVLLRKKAGVDGVAGVAGVAGAVRIATNVAPGNDFIGCLLPYSPLHYLLLEHGPLVMTSGNVSDEPIVRTNREARERLTNIADAFLLHDRDIEVVCDDSVVRCVEQQLLPVRRSRGYAPMPVPLGEPGPAVLAVGGEIKSTFCITRDHYAYLSQHIGDMGNIETLDALKRSVDHFLRLFRVQPEAVAADLHPGYLSGQWAQSLAASLGVPLIRVQHHFAHVVALRAEHGLPRDQPIIGCCFDGTGYGTDQTIWGGEFLLARPGEFERAAHLSYSPLPGGDAAIRRPYRVALAQLWSAGIPWDERLPCVQAAPAEERPVLRPQLERDLNCVPTSSAGRLFDGVASLIGIRHQVNYEAQAAMEMEACAASRVNDVIRDAYTFDIEPDEPGRPIQIRYEPVLRSLCDDVLAGDDPAAMAARFHHAMASMIVRVCRLIQDRHAVTTVGLTGGVFQNVLLLKLVKRQLEKNGFKVLTHRLVPPNDGGIALGQAVVARHNC